MMMVRIGLATILALSAMSPAAGQSSDRLPTIPPAQYDAAQQQAAKAFEEARHKPVSGPFEPMMYSPEVMTRARAMGDYMRYRSRFPEAQSEFVILIVARAWNQDYEWSAHAPIAAKAGIAPDIVAALREGRRPVTMTADQTLLYDFASVLLRDKRVGDATFARTEGRFGKPGIVDLVGLIGYYSFDAMMLNTANYRPASGETLPPRP